jgi:hypothetical protein
MPSLAAFVLAISLFATPSHAVSISFQQNVLPSPAYLHDANGLFSDSVFATTPGGLGAGIETVMRVGAAQPAQGGFMRGVLGFDLGAIPSDHVITSVSLTLVVDSGDNSSSLASLGAIDLHEIAGLGDNFVETEVTWFARRTAVPWADPGGDFNPTVLSSVAAFDPTIAGAVRTWATSAAFVAAAQAALDAGAPLQLLLRSPSTEAGLTTGEVFARFHSDDSASLALRPLLAIDFEPAAHVPEPSMFGLLALAGLALGLRTYRRKS